MVTDSNSQSPFLVGQLRVCLNATLPTLERGRQKEGPWWESFQGRNHIKNTQTMPTCADVHLAPPSDDKGVASERPNSGPPLHPSLSPHPSVPSSYIY